MKNAEWKSMEIPSQHSAPRVEFYLEKLTKGEIIPKLFHISICSADQISAKNFRESTECLHSTRAEMFSFAQIFQADSFVWYDDGEKKIVWFIVNLWKNNWGDAFGIDEKLMIFLSRLCKTVIISGSVLQTRKKNMQKSHCSWILYFLRLSRNIIRRWKKSNFSMRLCEIFKNSPTSAAEAVISFFLPHLSTWILIDISRELAYLSHSTHLTYWAGSEEGKCVCLYQNNKKKTCNKKKHQIVHHTRRLVYFLIWKWEIVVDFKSIVASCVRVVSAVWCSVVSYRRRCSTLVSDSKAWVS